MARYDHRNRIPPQRLSDCAAGLRLTDSSGQLTVRDDLPHGDIGGSLQYAALKRGHQTEIDGKVKSRTSTREVFAQFGHDPAQFLRRGDDVGPRAFVNLGDEGRLVLGK